MRMMVVAMSAVAVYALPVEKSILATYCDLFALAGFSLIFWGVRR